MSTRKKLLSATLIISGSVTLSLALYPLFVEMILAPGDPARIVSSMLGYLVFSMACIVIGSAMWKRFKVPVAEFSLIGGAFCLGIAFRSIGPNANVLGTIGLVAFVLGYFILKSAADRGRHRRVLSRISEKPLSPSAEALAEFPLSGSSQPVRVTSSLSAMSFNFGPSVRPEYDREAALEALRRAC